MMEPRTHPRCSDPSPSCFPLRSVQTRYRQPLVHSGRYLDPSSQVVRSEERAERPTPDRVHRSRFQVNQDRPGHVLSSRGLVVVHIDSLELQVGGTLVRTVGLDAVLLRDDLPVCQKRSMPSQRGITAWKQRGPRSSPELGTDLVTALTGLQVDNLSH